MVSAAPSWAAQLLTIVDYRNKTYFRDPTMLRKLEPAVLIREGKERIRQEGREAASLWYRADG